MQKILSAMDNIRLFDDLARKKSAIHSLHPVAKLITTFAFLLVLVSFGRYEIIKLLPFVAFPLFMIIKAELPLIPLGQRLLVVEPLIVGVGILNPLFDPAGWLTFASIMIKATLTVVAALVLVGTTGMDRLASALYKLKVPDMFVLQLTLTYRYIFVLVEELVVMMRAYSLRSYTQKGISFKDGGPFVGQLLLRTLDRAQRVHYAMGLRGFRGRYPDEGQTSLKAKDLVFALGWIGFFLLCRFYNWPALLGLLLGGIQ